MPCMWQHANQPHANTFTRKHSSLLQLSVTSTGKPQRKLWQSCCQASMLMSVWIFLQNSWRCHHKDFAGHCLLLQWQLQCQQMHHISFQMAIEWMQFASIVSPNWPLVEIKCCIVWNHQACQWSQAHINHRRKVLCWQASVRWVITQAKGTHYATTVCVREKLKRCFYREFLDWSFMFWTFIWCLWVVEDEMQRDGKNASPASCCFVCKRASIIERKGW